MQHDIRASNRVATIYGPNGSGKSRFVGALAFMKHFVIESAKATQAGDPIGVRPFRFDVRTLDKSARFEIAFIQDGTAYEFGFGGRFRTGAGGMAVRAAGRRQGAEVAAPELQSGIGRV